MRKKKWGLIRVSVKVSFCRGLKRRNLKKSAREMAAIPKKIKIAECEKPKK